MVKTRGGSTKKNGRGGSSPGRNGTQPSLNEPLNQETQRPSSSQQPVLESSDQIGNPAMTDRVLHPEGLW